MIFEVDNTGKAKFIYTDELADLIQEGNATITRVSNVEPVPGGWKAFMKDGHTIAGPDGMPFKYHKDALAAEVKYLEETEFAKDE